ncbi:MAG: hypothetical protein GY716_05580 [bacterium]|nr:hypothetical protein [bacterium]
MADYTREQVIKKIKNGDSLERCDLRHVKLGQADLSGANLRRADLEGVNFERTKLDKANLANANLCDAYLVGANLESARLTKADLEGANLEGANLQNADLSRANLEGATLEGANLNGARMHSCQLELANLGGAQLVGVELVNADMREAYFGGARLLNADLQFVQGEKVNLEEADLTQANLTEANLRGAFGDGSNFARSILERATLDGSSFNKADFTDADLRGGSLRECKMNGAKLTGARLAGTDASPEQFDQVNAEWVDFSTRTNEVKVQGHELVDYYARLKSGAPVLPPEMLQAMESGAAPAANNDSRRYFGKGDVLRNASLEFGGQSLVEIDSRFESCTIKLVEGTKLIIGQSGKLEGCRITGSGNIEVHGWLSQEGDEPCVVGPRQLVVGKSGRVRGTVKQHADLTQFGFERGCAMNLRIQRA